MEATARVATANAKRYLGQFCKHFAHKLPVELAETNETGKVEFGAGRCALAADEASLTMTVTAPDAGQLASLKDVVDRHLVRFAFREELALAWQ